MTISEEKVVYLEKELSVLEEEISGLKKNDSTKIILDYLFMESSRLGDELDSINRDTNCDEYRKKYIELSTVNRVTSHIVSMLLKS